MSILYKFLLLGSDIFLVNFSLFFALLLFFNGAIPENYGNMFAMQWLVLTVIHLLCNLGFRSYQCMLKYITTRELMYLLTCNISGSLVFSLYGLQTGHAFPVPVYVMSSLFLLLFAILSRFSYKFIHRTLRKLFKNYTSLHEYIDKVEQTRTLIIGAGDAAAILIKESKQHPKSEYNIVVAVDDDKSKHRSYLNGVPIRGPISNLNSIIEDFNITDIIIAIPSAKKDRLSEIITACTDSHLKFKIFPGIPNTLTSEVSLSQLRSVKIEDLLGRDEIVLDNNKLNEIINKHTILVTGGGGSIGSELCRQIAAFNPKRLIIFDIYENNAYDIQNELLLNGLDPQTLTTVIGSIRDKEKLNYVFQTYKPSLVYHAAAHKHVPLMENNPEEAIKNNVFGTLNLALCAKQYKTKKFVLISTDKAVNPTNVMGATKRMCEMIVQSLNATTPDTQFVAVRFGNVLGSNGSVIPLFKRQLEAGGPLTVTHPDIIRYFMTIPEAVRLVLQASSFADGGEIFILDMGQPVKILDLAINFIKLSGLEPYKDIDIRFTGLRPGEKLYEELLMSEEGMTSTTHDKIFIAKPLELSFEQVSEKVKKLENTLLTQGDIPQALSEVVPTYVMSPNGSYKKAI